MQAEANVLLVPKEAVGGMPFEVIPDLLGWVRVSDHCEQLDRAIVNTQIGIVNTKIGHGEHLDRAS